MKQKTVITCNNPDIEVVVAVSVRTNGAGKNSLANYESRREFNRVCDSLHGALVENFHARNIKFSR